jgi:PAS domain S-box-containing protein
MIFRRRPPGLGAAAFAPAALALVEPADIGHRVVEVNAAWESLLGGSAAAVGQALAEPGSDVAAAVALAAGSGGAAPLMVAGRPLTLRTGAVVGTTALVVELARPDRPFAGAAEEATRHLWDLFDSANALIYVKDTEGRYLLANEDYTRRFGVRREEILGRTDDDLYPGGCAGAYSDNDRRVLESGDLIQAEEPYADMSGATDQFRRWVSIKFPLFDSAGEPYGLGGISTDITERKRAEDAATWARFAAEQASRKKDEFLSRMSHELRTPLNAVVGFADLLRLQPLPAPAAQQVEQIAEAGKHLVSLVNDALDIAWIEAGSPGMELIGVPAAGPLSQALAIIRPLAAAQEIEIASDLHEALNRWIVADPRRLRQVFLNLLGNAVKFNQPRGLVRVSCRIDGDVLRYRFTDTGPGLSEADCERLFTPFSRGSGADRTEGTGLGLALSRGLVEEMGGRVGLERSAPGEGSTFYVDVPTLLPRDGAVTGDPAVAAVQPGLPRILAATVVQIEDSLPNQRLVEGVIEAMGGARLHSATSGVAGLTLVEDVSPDLLLLDLNLPDISGREVLARLRRGGRDLKVIVLSADATPSSIEELRELGIAEYVTKPLDVRELARAIAEALAP